MELPATPPLPCRTVLVPGEPVAHALRRELIRASRSDALAGTRFVPPAAAAIEVLHLSGVDFIPGETALRRARLLPVLRAGLPLAHFPIELLTSRPGWDGAFAWTIADLEAAGLRPRDLETAGAAARLRDVAAVWRALDESAGLSWMTQRIYLEAALALETEPDRWPYPGAVLVAAGHDATAAEARFFRAIPRATFGILAARPVRGHYLERVEALFGGPAAAALRSTPAPRSSGTERDLLASYFFEPPAVLADADRPRRPLVEPLAKLLQVRDAPEHGHGRRIVTGVQEVVLLLAVGPRVARIHEECEHRLGRARRGIDLEPGDRPLPVPTLLRERDPAEPVGDDHDDRVGAGGEVAAFGDRRARSGAEELHRDGLLPEPHHRLDDPRSMLLQVLGRR